MQKKIILFLIGIIMIPSVIFAAPTFRIDMDADLPGLQSDIWVNPGDSFTANVEVVLNDSDDTLSSFSYSLWWDTGELNTPVDADITTYPLESGWIDVGYLSISSPYIYYFSQMNFNHSEGSLTGIVASIDWTAPTPVTDGSIDINPGFYHAWDMAFDKDGNSITPTFEGGTVNIVPEPISSILFVTGGATFAFRRQWKKRHKA